MIVRTINEKIEITTNDKIGRSNVVISSEHFKYEGDEILITLNYKYLKEAINVFDDKIYIHLSNAQKPIKISDIKNNNNQIISPMIS